MDSTNSRNASFIIDTSRAHGMQLRNEFMNVPTKLQRPTTKQLFLTSRNDNVVERISRFKDVMASQLSRPLYSSFRLSNSITCPIALKSTHFTIPGDVLYNIHANYANDTLLLYRGDTNTTQSITIPPGRYTSIYDVLSAINQVISEPYVQFSYNTSYNRVEAQSSGYVESSNNTTAGIFLAQQFGGLAEILGFSATESNYYNPETGILSFMSSRQVASSPPKLWTFQQVFLHVDDHLGGLGRAQSDTCNEILVSNTESGLDQVFAYYQGSNSHQSLALQNAAPKGFHLALASVSLLSSSMSTPNVISLHNNSSTEGIFIDRAFTHHSASQYNNMVLSQITVSFTNEFGQLLVGPPTIDYNVMLEITTSH